MNKLFTHSFLAVAIAASAPVALCSEVDKAPQQTYTTEAYYGTHLLTGLLSMASVPVCTLAGIEIGVGAMVALGSSDHPLPIITGLAGLTAALTILYKTPQWTDRFFFQKQPTTKQNLINFISRCLLVWAPGFNILFGTYVSNNIDIQEERAS